MDAQARHAVTVLRQILRATEAYDRIVTRSTGLTSSQLLLLQILEDSGPSLAGTISTKMGISQATTTSLLHKLEDKGLIVRRRGDTDRRQVWLSITDRGHETLAQAPEGLQIKFGERFATLADWERSMLIAGLERTAAMLDAENIDASAVLTIGDLGPNQPG
ncbi:MAG: MarR family transcriptional regulator [Alphaproteobacteria bacterium]